MNKIILCGFDYSNSNTYKELTKVLIKSIEKYEPDALWILNWLCEPDSSGQIRGIVSNTVKLNKWVEELNNCDDDDNVIFLDCDMLLIGPLFDVFEKDFDIAYTKREEWHKLPLNGGAIYVKVNNKTRLFFNMFKEINNKMYNNPEFHQKWRDKYAGINQAAFGYLLENKDYNARIIDIPCSKWNVCRFKQESVDKDARLIHFKGSLRKALFSKDPVPKDIEFLVKKWKETKKEYDKNPINI